MRSLGYFAAALTFCLLVASPALAKVAMIETAAPIHDKSQEAVKAALKEAVSTAAKGALAMGLPWVQVRDAQVLQDAVAVQVLATDEAPAQDDQANGDQANKDKSPGAERAPGPNGSGQPSHPDQAEPDQPSDQADL